MLSISSLLSPVDAVIVIFCSFCVPCLRVDMEDPFASM